MNIPVPRRNTNKPNRNTSKKKKKTPRHQTISFIIAQLHFSKNSQNPKHNQLMNKATSRLKIQLISFDTQISRKVFTQSYHVNIQTIF